MNITPQDIVREKIILRKIEIPPVVIKKKISKIVSKEKQINFKDIKLTKPKVNKKEIEKYILTTDEFNKGNILVIKSKEKIQYESDYIDIYEFSIELADNYKLPLMDIYTRLKEFYPEGEILEQEVIEIKNQIEDQTKNYEIKIEIIEQALALIKKEGFEEERKDDQKVFVTEIMYHKDKADKLLLKYDELAKLSKKNKLIFGFHYTPYNFDSVPERYFFENILRELNEDADNIADIYFTGAITDPQKTEFLFEYRDKQGNWHNYSPDFLIRKKDGKMLIVEIKGEPFRDEQKEKEMIELEKINPNTLKYEILETEKDSINFNELEKVKKWIY